MPGLIWLCVCPSTWEGVVVHGTGPMMGVIVAGAGGVGRSFQAAARLPPLAFIVCQVYARGRQVGYGSACCCEPLPLCGRSL